MRPKRDKESGWMRDSTGNFIFPGMAGYEEALQQASDDAIARLEGWTGEAVANLRKDLEKGGQS